MENDLDGKELYNQLRATYHEDLKNGSKIQTKQAYRQEIKDIEADFENVIPSSFYFGMKDFLRDFEPHESEKTQRLIEIIQMAFRPIYRWHDMDFINVDNLFFPGNEYTLLIESIESIDEPKKVVERLKSKIEAVQEAHVDGFKRRIDQLALKSCISTPANTDKVYTDKGKLNTKPHMDVVDDKFLEFKDMYGVITAFEKLEEWLSNNGFSLKEYTKTDTPEFFSQAVLDRQKKRIKRNKEN